MRESTFTLGIPGKPRFSTWVYFDIDDAQTYRQWRAYASPRDSKKICKNYTVSLVTAPNPRQMTGAFTSGGNVIGAKSTRAQTAGRPLARSRAYPSGPKLGSPKVLYIFTIRNVKLCALYCVVVSRSHACCRALCCICCCTCCRLIMMH